jgi:predicted glycoside hydrolase/deacetylase ChbG (UPF0249 family)
MKPKRLIVNADDCGWSIGITDGIVLAHKTGVVTSASLMANQPASEYAIEALHGFQDLGIGVHLNLTQGYPVSTPSEVPTLVRADGTFYPAPETVARLKKWQASPREIEREFRAQINWVKVHGIPPTHVDSHNNVHFYPCAIGAFRRAAMAEDIRCARPLRQVYSPNDGHWGGPYSGRLFRRLLLQGYMATTQVVMMHGMRLPDLSLLPHPRYLTGLNMLKQGWTVMLANLGPGTYELGCHPGLFEVGFSETDCISAQREREVETLTDSEFRKAILSNGFELANYRDLVELPSPAE